MASKIRCNDIVIVITGKDKGKIGKVKKIFTKINKVLINGINITKKHQKKKIILKELPINISNVSIFNEITNKKDKIGFKYINNKKYRYYKSNNKIL